MVLVKETGDQCAGRLASVPVDLDEQVLAEVTCPAGVTECVDDFILPMLAGTVSPSDVTEQVADDTASLAYAGILFPADSAGIPFPTIPAGIPFLLALFALMGSCPHLTLPKFPFRLFLLGCRSQQALYALLALLGRCPV